MEDVEILSSKVFSATIYIPQEMASELYKMGANFVNNVEYLNLAARNS